LLAAVLSILRKTPLLSRVGGVFIGQSSFLLFFFLDEKETKNQDLGFSAIKIGSLPKTQKLPRSQTRGLKQFEFLYGSFSFLILACQIQWSEKSPEVLLWILEFGISLLEFI
jgi:hypothetical protein